jgi:Flp pilus assembly protein TadD
MMGQKPDAKLAPEIAQELCQRTGSAAVLDGSIAQIGTQYLLTLKAVNCASGESLASTEAQASDKNHVLDALGKTASEIRNKLGESLNTVQKYDTPLEQATTPSLEALQAYSMAWKNRGGKGEFAATVPLLQRAIRLDPNFAMAYAVLGVIYAQSGESGPGAENTRKAYELRERVSEPERLHIECNYYYFVTGDSEKATQAFELLAQTYPRDYTAHSALGHIYKALGTYDKALLEALTSLRLNPGRSVSYPNLADAYIKLSNFAQAQAAIEEAEAKKLDSPSLHLVMYELAFLQNEAAGMAKQVAWAAGKPGIEDELLVMEADTAAYSGRLRDAREFSRRAIDSAERSQETETAATYSAVSGLREALFGNAEGARRQATLEFGPSAGRDVQYSAALALAYAGDGQARTVTENLGKRFPKDTIVQFNYLPTLDAKLSISGGNSSEALDSLRAATPYELGQTPYSAYGWTGLYPIFARGEAYLAAHQGGEAAAEFQKILDHRGIVLNEPIGALAHLQIGRAYVMQGDRAKAKAAYQDFLSLWKDADPDIPVFIAAQTEYAKLQ